LAEKLGNVDVTLCRAEGIGVLEGVERSLQIHSQPIFASGSTYWILDILLKNNKKENGTLLIGQSGNGTVSWPTVSIMKKIRMSSFKRRLNLFKLKYSIYYGNWENNLLLKQELIKMFRLKEYVSRMLEASYLCHKNDMMKARVELVRPEKDIIGDLWFKNGIEFKLECRDPTIDLKLLNFLFGIPQSKTFFYQRGFLYRNFTDYFSDELFNGAIRGLQSCDLSERFAKEVIKPIKPTSSIFNTFVSLRKYDGIFKKASNIGEFNLLLNAYAMELFIKKLL
jgi:hypothetical protein